MVGLKRAGFARAREFTAALSLVDVRREHRGDELCDGLRRLIDSQFACIYQPVMGAGGTEMGLLGAAGGTHEQARRGFAHLTTERGVAYDPLRPAPRQRNVALSLAQLGELTPGHGVAESPIPAAFRVVFGVAATDQLRMLVCRGVSLLAWVGGHRMDHRPFGAMERALLHRVRPALYLRLDLEERLRTVDLYRAGLDAALSAWDQPAWLLNTRGSVVAANAAGRQRVERGTSELRATLHAAQRTGVPGFRVQHFTAASLGRHSLVVESGPQATLIARAARAASEWGLTPREQQVTTLVAQGLTNEAIGRELDCAPHTVEIHLTRVYDKAKVPNRATLVARFWMLR